MKLATFIVTFLVARAFAIPICDDVLNSQRQPLLTSTLTYVFGKGEVVYLNGKATHTNRRVLFRSGSINEGKARVVERERTELVEFPPGSSSAMELVRVNGAVFLRVEEFWDLFQGFDDGYFGASGFHFAHFLPVVFTQGSFEMYEIGETVSVQTTPYGARMASQDMQEIIRLMSVNKERPQSLSGQLRSNEIIAAMFRYVPEVTEQFIDEVLELARRVAENPDVKGEILEATPELQISVSGTKFYMRLHYLNDMKVQAKGEIYSFPK